MSLQTHDISPEARKLRRKGDYFRHGNGMFKDVELGVFQKEDQWAWSGVTWEKRVENEIGNGQGLELAGSYKGY